MRLTSIRRRRRRRRRWRQRPEIFRRRWSVATPVGLHPSYVATDHRRFLTTNPGGTPLIIRGKLFRQPRPALIPDPKFQQYAPDDIKPFFIMRFKEDVREEPGKIFRSQSGSPRRDVS